MIGGCSPVFYLLIVFLCTDRPVPVPGGGMRSPDSRTLSFRSYGVGQWPVVSRREEAEGDRSAVMWRWSSFAVGKTQTTLVFVCRVSCVHRSTDLGSYDTACVLIESYHSNSTQPARSSRRVFVYCLNAIYLSIAQLLRLFRSSMCIRVLFECDLSIAESVQFIVFRTQRVVYLR